MTRRFPPAIEGRNPLYTTVRDKPADLIPLPSGSGDCRAETYDGITHKRCTRPAGLLRDGLAVCQQHGHLDSVRAFEA